MTVSTSAPGTSVGRYVKALGMSRGDPLGAAAYAAGQPWHSTPQVLTTLEKAIQEPLSTQDGGLYSGPVGFDFSAFLRPATLIGKLPLARVPFRTRLLVGTGGARAAWVQEGSATPVSSAAYSTGVTLEPLRVASIAVLSRELILVAAVAAETAIAAEVRAALMTELDRSFIDPTFVGVADVSPASITAGAVQVVSSGTTVEALDSDLARVLQVLISAGMSLDSAWWVMAPADAARMSLMRSGGAPAWPGLSAKGGVLAGLPVATSSVCTTPGSPTLSFIALVQCDQVLLSDDGQADLAYSQNAALQMQTSPTADANSSMSVWQSNNVAIRATKFCNWATRRPGAAAVLVDVQF